MLQLKFLNKDYGKKVADKKWPYFSAHGFFSRQPAPGYYSIDWNTYNGEIVEVTQNV